MYNSGIIPTQTSAVGRDDDCEAWVLQRLRKRHGQPCSAESMDEVGRRIQQGASTVEQAEEGVLVWNCDILQRAGFPLSVKDVTALAAMILRK